MKRLLASSIACVCVCMSALTSSVSARTHTTTHTLSPWPRIEQFDILPSPLDPSAGYAGEPATAQVDVSVRLYNLPREFAGLDRLYISLDYALSETQRLRVGGEVDKEQLKDIYETLSPLENYGSPNGALISFSVFFEVYSGTEAAQWSIDTNGGEFEFQLVGVTDAPEKDSPFLQTIQRPLSDSIITSEVLTSSVPTSFTISGGGTDNQLPSFSSLSFTPSDGVPVDHLHDPSLFVAELTSVVDATGLVFEAIYDMEDRGVYSTFVRLSSAKPMSRGRCLGKQIVSENAPLEVMGCDFTQPNSCDALLPSGTYSLVHVVVGDQAGNTKRYAKPGFYDYTGPASGSSVGGFNSIVQALTDYPGLAPQLVLLPEGEGRIKDKKVVFHCLNSSMTLTHSALLLVFALLSGVFLL